MNTPSASIVTAPVLVDADRPERLARPADRDEPLVRIGLPDGVAAWLVLDAGLIGQVMVDPRISEDLHGHWPPLRDKRITAAWPLYSWLATSMLTSDGLEHGRLRELARESFSTAGIAELEGYLGVAVEQLCDRLAETPEGQIVDLRREFADEFSIRAICLLLGVDLDHAATVGACAAAILDSGLDPQPATADAERMYQAVGALLEFKRANPREDGRDLTTELLAAHATGQLTEQQLSATVALIVAAGVETTAHWLDHSIHTLLTRPRLRVDALYGAVSWTTLIKETLRSRPPLVRIPSRVATEDTVVGGVPIEAGELILVSLGAAGLLGEPLARRVAAIGIPMLMQRFPHMALSIDPSEIEQRRGGIVDGHRALPVRLGRPAPILTYTFTDDGPTRAFHRRQGEEPAVELVGVGTDLYRTTDPAVCRFCEPPARWETRVTIVHRVHEPNAPWYIAAEIHRCQCAHATLICRAVPTVVRPVDDHEGVAHPDHPDVPVRAFSIAPVAGDEPVTVVSALEIDSHVECPNCERYYGLTLYEIIDETPAWLYTHGINWCAGCGVAQLTAHTREDHTVTDAPTPELA
ncbi:hypothetical protein ACTD5D_09720 [Nocardia takedensis]|uniref:hypothetical protein n=1 Tax=Nocardia takedensis TaxID=259390 RepID=UPI003F7592DD